MVSTLEALGLLSMALCLGITWWNFRYNSSGSGQSRLASVVEAWVNIFIGFTVNFIANHWLIPMMTGVELAAAANWWGGWVYTALSMLRQLTIRRWFNDRIHLFAARAARKLA